MKTGVGTEFVDENRKRFQTDKVCRLSLKYVTLYDVPMFTDRLLSNNSTYMVRLDRTIFGFRKRYGKSTSSVSPFTVIILVRFVAAFAATVYAFLRWFCTEIEGERESLSPDRIRRKTRAIVVGEIVWYRNSVAECVPSVSNDRTTRSFPSNFLGFRRVRLGPLKCEIETSGQVRVSDAFELLAAVFFIAANCVVRETRKTGTRSGVAKSEKRAGNGEEERREKRRDVHGRLLPLLLWLSRVMARNVHHNA